jgi:hypothetical protein
MPVQAMKEEQHRSQEVSKGKMEKCQQEVHNPKKKEQLQQP